MSVSIPEKVRRLFLLSNLFALMCLFNSGAFAQTPCDNCANLNLPSVGVSASHLMPGGNSFFDITLSGIDSGQGHDIVDGTYLGWCIEDNHRENTTAPVQLFSSCDPSLPGNLGLDPHTWNWVNYILNHKQGDKKDVQDALWLITLWDPTKVPTATALDMVNEAMVHGSDFCPGPGQVVAIILYTGDGGIGQTCGIAPFGIQDSIIEFPVEEPCFDCDGGVTQLSLVYLPAGDVYVRIKEGKKKILFEGTVSGGVPFTIDGTGKDGKIGKEIKIYVDGNENAKIHTSCSKPIGPGLISGDFSVVSGMSLRGGLLCPVPPPDPNSVCETGKPQVLTMQYTGDNCLATDHNQDPEKVYCDGDPVYNPTVNIIATDKSNPDDPKAKTWFDATVTLNGTFDIDATNYGETKLKAHTHVHIYDTFGKWLQSLEFHTSCSQPLAVGDQFGSLALEAFIAE